jgi:hypothetical protein
MRNAYNISVGKSSGKRLLMRCRRRWEDTIRINLKEIECGLDSSSSEYIPVAGFCEYGNEPSRIIKDEEFFDQQSDYQLLKKDSAPWS